VSLFTISNGSRSNSTMVIGIFLDDPTMMLKVLDLGATVGLSSFFVVFVTN
jgi:hypothetical protein